MNQPIETWLTAVAYSHSQSKSTAYQYKKNMQDYCKFTHTTPNKILTEYENSDEKTFKRKHSEQIQQWISKLFNQKLAITTIRTKIGAIKSFYKYQSLPLGYIPQARETITYHNRDIEANEIAQIIALSPLREKAYYTLMAQSGLRPCTIEQLQIKDLENLDNEQTTYKITVPQEKEKGKFGSHPTFIGNEATKYLKLYLATRTNLTPNSLLFTAHNKNTPSNTKNISRAFQHTAQKLQKTGILNYEVRKAKPSEIRLYTLRKFFKRKCKDMGDEDTNYLMGHTIVGSNKNYAPKNDEYYRKRYEEKALPDLKIESPIPKEIDELQKQHKQEIETIKNQYQNENEELKTKLKTMEKQIETFDQNLATKIEQLVKKELKKTKQQIEKEIDQESEQVIEQELTEEHLKWIIKRMKTEKQTNNSPLPKLSKLQTQKEKKQNAKRKSANT